jgi:multidrug resistance efflux pump
MFEMMFCSLVTIVPDYLYRRFVQGKRFGKEITLFSVWYELRWGITGCLVLTVTLITVIFYTHPSTTSATLFFRTVPILPETNGRVAEIFVGTTGTVEMGAPLFRLDSSKQEAAMETARRKIAEVEAAFVVAQSDIAKAEGQLQEAQGAHQQALDELETKEELQKRNAGIVAQRDIEKLAVRVDSTRGGVAAATAAKESIKVRL